MKTTNYPPSVILTIIVLSFTAVITSQYAAIAFGKWTAFSSEAFPIAVLFYVVGLCLLPILAIIDIFHAKISGRYLALLTLMILLGMELRALHQIGMPMFRHDAVIRFAAIYTALMVLIGNIAMIYRLGFGKNSNEFFGQACE